MNRIPIRTAVRIRGDFWALQLASEDPRGHRTNIADSPGFSEESASRRYRAMREFGKSVSESARIVQVCANAKYRV